MTTLVRKYNTVPSLINELYKAQLIKEKSKNYNMSQIHVNVAENENDFWIELAAPGYEKNQISLKLDNNVLTVSADVLVDENNKVKYSKKEFSTNSFTKSFSLPENVINESKIEASYENGVLYIQLPKKEEIKPKNRKIIIE